MADTQFGMMGGNKHWATERQLAMRAVEHINRLKPRFVVLCGDLIHMLPGKDPITRNLQLEDFKFIMQHVDPSIPFVCVCGNHDVGDAPTPLTIAKYASDFGDDYFSFWVGGCLCIVLNTCLYYDNARAPQLYRRQINWLAAELEIGRAADAQHILVFGHHPWFITSPYEDSALLDTPWSFTDDAGMRTELPEGSFAIPKERRMETLDLFWSYGVTACFAGHCHQNRSVLVDEHNFEMITSSAVGAQSDGGEGSGFRIVQVYPTCIRHAYHTFDAMPASVSMNPAYVSE